jgi:hypothetical protein
MAATLTDVVDVARRNFEAAQAGFEADKTAAKSPAEVRRVRENRDAALSAYMDLLSAGLEEFTGDWDILAASAQDAGEKIEEATAEAVAGPEKIRLLAQATSSLTTVASALRRT